MKTALFAVLFLYSLSAFSVDRVSAGDRIRVGSKVIVVGDTKAQVSAAGDPESVTDVENNFGVKIAEDWHYTEHGKEIIVRISNDGKVIMCGELLGR